MRLRLITASTVVLAVTAAAMLALAGSVAAVESALPAGNLVKNPGAESPVGGPTPSSPPITHPAVWTSEDGLMADGQPGRPVQSIRYGSWDLTTAMSAAIGGGRTFLSGGYAGKISRAFQIIDVSRAATDIDTGGVKACLSAYLGGARQSEYAAQATLQFVGEGDAPRGQLSIGPVTQSGATAPRLLWRASERAVPAGTRMLRVSLTFTGFWASGAYADNVSVALTKGRCIPQLAVRCQRGALVATVTPSDAVRTQRVRFQIRGGKGKKLVTDARAPYSARVPMGGITGRLTVTATVTQAGSGNVVLTKKSRRC
jgi:hypothetical protein